MVDARAAAEVRVTFVHRGDHLGDGDQSVGGTMVPWYQCFNCSDRMEWMEGERFFECPGCAYQLTADEATALCDEAIRCVQTLAQITRTNRKRGFLWRLLRLFGGRRRQTSSS